MREVLVAGNWKMNGSRASITELVEGLRFASASQCESLICPPSVYLDFVANLLEGSPIKMGAQNVDWHAEGAFTGEISVQMIADAGCSYCIVGHSERRTLFAESDAAVAEKAGALLSAGIRPIVCVGESLAQRRAGEAQKVVVGQLMAVLQHLENGQPWSAEAVLAYEPIWAIGTGETATPEQAEEVHSWLRQALVEHCGDSTGADTRIIYGGSVKASNADSLFACENIDGALVGGASLLVDEFSKICQAAG